MFNLFFLTYFYLKERHYIETSIFPCKALLTLSFPTTAVVVEMLELVGTDPFNFISTGISRGELELCCCFNLNPFIPVRKGNFLPFLSFSTRHFLSFFSSNFYKPLQTLKNLPSLFYNSEGRG